MNMMPMPAAFAHATPLGGAAMVPIGVVIAITGASSTVLLHRAAVASLGQDADPMIAAAGTLGSQIKMRVGGQWLVANVRSLALDLDNDGVLAEIDFLGEGDEERLTGKLYHFRRGVTRYPDSRLRGVRGRDRRPEADLCRGTTVRTSRSATSIRPATSVPHCISTRCSASISRWSDRRARASRPPPR